MIKKKIPLTSYISDITYNYFFPILEKYRKLKSARQTIGRNSMPHDQRTAFLEVGLWCREISRIRSDLSFHFMELKGKVRSTSTRSTTSVLLLVRRMHRTNPRRGERGIHQQSTQLMVLLVVIKKWQAGWFDKDQERSKKRDNAELPNNHGQRITQWFKVVTELFFTCS